jgi:hypothetical protein
MSSSFTITSPSNTVLLGPNGQGQATFTVSNISGRINRGRARLTPQNPASAGWITIEGEGERDFEIASTQQFVVNIVVPPKSPPGSYIFRLDMVGVDNPDEDLSQGPGVTFQVSAAPGPKPFPWWILAVAGGVVLIAVIVIIIAAVTGAKVKVPDITGLNQSEAEIALLKAGLTLGEVSSQPSSSVPIGIAIGSNPPAGDQVAKNASINLILSAGPAVTATFTPTATLPSKTPTITNTFTSTFTRIFTPTFTSTFTQVPTKTFTPTITPWPADFLAWYKLNVDGKDTTLHNGPLVLHNTTFTDGGIFCNGIYKNSGSADYCEITTPAISSFDFGRFTIQVQFKASERKQMPVIMGGPSFRWIGYYLYANGHVALKYNNSLFLDCGQSYNAGTWYTAKITYDGVNVRLYLNGTQACSMTTGLVHNNERVFTVTDYSNAGIFKGVIRDLQIRKVVVP